MGWLECLVWPGQTNRLDRLRATAAIARQEPLHLVAGDLTDTSLRWVIAAAGVTVVLVMVLFGWRMRVRGRVTSVSDSDQPR
ncbi:DUF2332 domain-containing protein (plasmid) [Rhodococcus qingshengii]|nr:MULTISPECIES: DUF2332 family protein [Rhodococcus erythropolis group]UUE28699.1 DUF2332 domain-containing protein [Rhodococcus qingshengii]